MRPIDADELLQRIEARERSLKFYVDRAARETLWDVVDDINDSDILDYAPVRHGEWIEDELEYPEEVVFRYKCSECGRTELVKEPYCHCGAKMGGEK